jgi:ABC-type transport system substrate-binding protein
MRSRKATARCTSMTGSSTRGKLPSGFQLSHQSFVAAWSVSVLLMARCAPATGPQESRASSVTLTIGIGQLAAESDIAGVQQLKQILTREGLVNFSEDGRPKPALAEGWTTAADGSSLAIRLRTNATFHDGSPVDAETIVTILKNTLPAWMGPAFDDIDEITAPSRNEIRIGLRRPSPLLIEALESPIRKSNGAATGAFKAAPDDKPELFANGDYYFGKPAIDKIVIQRYPSVRAAWAELLRNRIDMLYEVGPDALESLTAARDTTMFTFVRHYQLLLIFNTRLPAFRDASIRRAFNLAVNRDNLIADGLNGHGLPSSGPIWPNYWAVDRSRSGFSYDPSAAAEALKPRSIKFVCLVAPDAERVALVLKQQLEAVGVEMILREVSLEELGQAFVKRDFDAVLTDFISGPSIFRVYRAWHSQGSLGAGVGTKRLDDALDRIRFATTDDEYRAAVRLLQDVNIEDPPAVFIAWSERARAVTSQFQVPVEPARDPLTTLRLWRPSNDREYVNRN